MKNLFSVLFFALVAGVMLWAGNAFAQEKEVWDIVLDGPGYRDGSFQYSRKLIFISFALELIILAFIALLKKVSWLWLFDFICWIPVFVASGLTVDYLTTDTGGEIDVIKGARVYTNELDFSTILSIVLTLVVALTICLLPVFISLIQYKIRKIDKNLLKHRLWIWGACGLLFGVSVGVNLLVFLLFGS